MEADSDVDPALAILMDEISRNAIINETIAYGDSKIQRFYEDKVVFVTGGSGFLGKHLIEKLLRSCNPRKLYVLMRPKKQKLIEERLKELLDDEVYDVLREMKPDFAEKVIAVPGDVQELDIGLNDETKKMLIEEVDIIFHGAATVNFTDPLKKSTLTNVRGTREILSLAQACKNLKAFVYVSTAYTPATYSNAGKDVTETFYPTPISSEALIQFVDTVDESRLDEVTPALIKDYPNTYAFSKRVTEDFVRQMDCKMPIAVVRPGIVIGAYREPTPGWIEKSAMFGASGFVLGAGLGLLHVTYSKKDNQMSYVPVDLVNNAVIVAAYNTNERWTKGQRDIKIYAVVNSRNPMTLEKQEKILRPKGFSINSDKSVYYPFYLTTKFKFVYFILTWIFHYIPGYIVDGVLRLFGKQPILMNVYNKVYKLNDALAYYMMYDWKFHDDNLQEMYGSLSTNDKIIYNCDIADLIWERFLVIWCIGIRKFVIKDGLKNTKYARKKQFYLRIAHYIITPIYFYCLWKIFTLFLFIVNTLILLVKSFFVNLFI